MTALLHSSLDFKGDAFCSNGPVGDPMDTTTAISPPQYRFPDVPPPQYPSRSLSPPSSPFDSPSTSTSALPSANSSSLSLRPAHALALAPAPAQPAFSLRDFYLPTLTPDEILDTLDHLASTLPKKKSHARKQPAGHIPRPRNAFILFRCLFVSQQAVPASVEKDHRNISRIAGKVWKSMSHEERDPWVKASELEKARHEAKWPGYRYNPVQPQVLPRRFGQGILKPPADFARPVRPKREDDDDLHPLYGARPISQYARVGSVPPLDPGRDSKLAHVASLVREGKQGAALEAAYYTNDAPQFTMPWGDAPVAVPTPIRGAWYDMPPPPDSPPPMPAYSRLVHRRSSSCPPLPPAQGAFPFTNPDPWAAAAYTPSPAPSPSPFDFAFPAPSPFALPHADEAQDALRPLTAPAPQYEPPPRLAQRRGSSLDRAIASSSIAGAFGGPAWNPEALHNFARPHATPDVSTPTECTDSSRSATPALSPQSSFEFPRGRSAAPRAMALCADDGGESYSKHDIDDGYSKHDDGYSKHDDEDNYSKHDDAPMLACPRPSIDLLAPCPHSPAPPCRAPSPRTTLPARLFGSQGARLGLDLDLDLDLDISLGSPAADTPYSADTPAPYSAENAHYRASSATPESAFPRTPPYNFSYTQALMDTDPAVGADEFRAARVQ